MISLQPDNAVFVIEYLKDFAPRRAAEAAGFPGERGYHLLEQKDIAKAISFALKHRIEEPPVDSDWVLLEMIDNHRIARQQGNISASNRALSLIAKHKRVDAFASDKLKVSTDTDVLERLTSARARTHQLQARGPLPDNVPALSVDEPDQRPMRQDEKEDTEYFAKEREVQARRDANKKRREKQQAAADKKIAEHKREKQRRERVNDLLRVMAREPQEREVSFM